MSLNQTRAQKIRGALLSIAQNESVFLFVAFVSYSFLSTDVLAWYVDSIAAFNRFVVLPWGGALCLLRVGVRAVRDRHRAVGFQIHPKGVHVEGFPCSF